MEIFNNDNGNIYYIIERNDEIAVMIPPLSPTKFIVATGVKKTNKGSWDQGYYYDNIIDAVKKFKKLIDNR